MERKDFELPAANENVGDREDYRCDKLPLSVIHSAWIPDGTSLFNEHNSLRSAFVVAPIVDALQAHRASREPKAR